MQQTSMSNSWEPNSATITMTSLTALTFALSLAGCLSDALDIKGCATYLAKDDGVLCYQVFTEVEFTWQQAQAHCKSRGANLVTITSALENQAVADILDANSMYDTWIGAQEIHHTWRWLNGREVLRQGCYLDNDKQRDMDIVTTLVNNSYQNCADHCYDLGFRFAGVQAGTRCWCGRSFGRHGQTSTCNYICPGDYDSNCGGELANEILVTDGVPSMWDTDQPNNHQFYQTCCVITREKSFHFDWNDVICGAGHGTICQLQSPDLCSKQNNPANTTDGCYVIIDTRQSWFLARAQCVEMGGDLAEFASAEEMKFIVDHINGSAYQAETFWIGLTKWSWTWVTGSQFLYTNWFPDQPKGPDQNCAIMEQMYWKDANCNGSHPFICQYDNSTNGAGRPKSSSTTRMYTARTKPTSPHPTTPKGFENFGSRSEELRFVTKEVIIGLAAGGTVLIIITLIVVTYVMVKRKKKKKEDDDVYVKADHFFGFENHDNPTDSDEANYHSQTRKEKPDLHRNSSVRSGVVVTGDGTDPPDIIPGGLGMRDEDMNY